MPESAKSTMRSLLFPRRFIVALACASLALIAGCGQEGPELVSVTGVVTVDGGPPPGPGKIFFNPVQAAIGGTFRPATGAFDSTGRFEASTFKPGDGLPPGTYGIAVKCWDVPPTIGGPPPISHIAEKYASNATSGLELVVEPGAESVTVEYDLQGR